MTGVRYENANGESEIIAAWISWWTRPDAAPQLLVC